MIIFIINIITFIIILIITIIITSSWLYDIRVNNIIMFVKLLFFGCVNALTSTRSFIITDSDIT